ncbi:DoxX family protein [Acrocarpospora macrocephala]|uniref:DoxX family protein n=1 Tax=Acrocarpospora macrocephala TaxID=150177 RepID=A0A5M3WPP2_9ACTN|nr:DoxX family protein [Acrocarpospora macrocephala]GES09211.1 hypothetical protein Amac_028070 [Acrocarpospora macrocephala]
MNIALWIITGLLAVIFLASGAVKLIQPKEKLAASGMGFAEDFSAGAVKAIGTLEILAAVGLILPALLDIAPVLVPLAAVGLVLLMIGASITHLRRHEAQAIVVNLAFLALAALVAWGRFGPSPSPADPARRLATTRPGRRGHSLRRSASGSRWAS